MKIIDIKQHQNAMRAGIKAVQTITDYYTSKVPDIKIRVNPNAADSVTSYEILSNSVCIRTYVDKDDPDEECFHDCYQITPSFDSSGDKDYFTWLLRNLDEWLYRTYSHIFRNKSDFPIRYNFTSWNGYQAIDILGNEFEDAVKAHKREDQV